MTRKEKALQIFAQGFHCSQAVLAAYADLSGITEKQALKLGGCFGSGMRQGEVCGACTGALMVLGLLYGQYDKADTASRQRSNEVNDEMMKRFADQCGSYICNTLLGCDIRTKEGVQRARETKLFTELCPKMVAHAVDILEGIIAERGINEQPKGDHEDE